VDDRQNNASNPPNYGDLFRNERGSRQGGRIARRKNQKDFRANANADPGAEASEIGGEEIHAQSVAKRLAKKEKGFADSHTGNKIKT
jgi:hypothetical protein